MYPSVGADGHINLQLSPLQSFRSMCLGVHSPDPHNMAQIPSEVGPTRIFLTVMAEEVPNEPQLKIVCASMATDMQLIDGSLSVF